RQNGLKVGATAGIKSHDHIIGRRFTGRGGLAFAYRPALQTFHAARDGDVNLMIITVELGGVRGMSVKHGKSAHCERGLKRKSAIPSSARFTLFALLNCRNVDGGGSRPLPGRMLGKQNRGSTLSEWMRSRRSSD